MSDDTKQTHPLPEDGQEEKRLAFEAEQETKRQAFEARLEAQKAKREWLMLIITVAAVVTAAITAYDGRHARIEAKEAAEKALASQETLARAQLAQAENQATAALTEQRNQAAKAYGLQNKSVQAQIDAMQLDERPYVAAKITEIALSRSSQGFNSRVHLLLDYSGRTAPLSTTAYILCTQGAFERPNEVEKTVNYFRAYGVEIDLELNVKDVDRATTCSPTPPGKSPFRLTVLGVVIYKDVFMHEHKTYFCEMASIPTRLVNTPQFSTESLTSLIGCYGAQKRT